MTILGTVALRNFDFGCILTLKCELVYFQVDGDTRAAYVLNVPSVNSELLNYGNKIPVIFENPEDSHHDFILPSIVFKRTANNPAPSRMPFAGIVAVAPAIGQPKIAIGGKSGYARNEIQARADSYDITYDMNILARRTQELNEIVLHVMKIFRVPGFSFIVKDSLGDIRFYEGRDLSWSENSDLADIADRTAASTLSFTVEGEIDVLDPIEVATVQDIQMDFSVLYR